MPWGGGPILAQPDAYCEKFFGSGYGDYANITENQRFRDFDSNGQALHVMSGGTIRLRATNVSPHSVSRYEAAALRSKTNFKPDANKSYYITSRVKLPNVLGTWPAFFLIPSLEPDGQNQWPPEIDIFEGPINGNTGTNPLSITQHAQVWGQQTDSQRSEWTYLGSGFNSDFGYYVDGVSLRDRWIEIGAEWAQSGVCYFIDGVKTACENYRWVNNEGVSGNPATLIAYLAVGGPWAGLNGIDDNRFPADLEIDHIRVYQGNGQFVSSPGNTVVAMSPNKQTGGGDPNASREIIGPVNAGDDYASLGFTLLHSDEFNGTELDRTKWCTRLIYGGGPPLQVPDEQCTRFGQGTADFAASDQSQRFRDFDSNGNALHQVSNGTLKLIARKTGTDPAVPFESAAIRSKFEFRSGGGVQHYVTARVRLPDVKGVWPSLSMMSSLGTDGVASWPPQLGVFDAPINGADLTANTLIQASQNDGNQTESGEHVWFYSSPGFDRTASVQGAANSLRGRWLEIGTEWGEEGVCYFLNGRPSGCESYLWRKADGQVANMATLIGYLAVGGQLAGSNGVDEDSFPVQMEIDWIRVYRRQGF